MNGGHSHVVFNPCNMNARRRLMPVERFDEDRLAAGMDNKFSFANARQQTTRFPTRPEVAFIHRREME